MGGSHMDGGHMGGNVVGIGTDLVEVDRMRDLLSRRPRFVDRVFTTGERTYCEAAVDPSERFAVRFAAKEAVLKALGVGLGGADFSDIEVIRAESGKPDLRITGRAAALAEEQGIYRWLITMSHSESMAQAFVVALGDDRLA